MNAQPALITVGKHTDIITPSASDTMRLFYDDGTTSGSSAGLHLVDSTGASTPASPAVYYKEFSFIPIQTGTNAPDITELSPNPFGNYTTARLNPGVYRVIFTGGALINNRTIIVGGYSDGSALNIFSKVIDINTLYFYSFVSGTGTDGKFDGKVGFILRVFPFVP